MKKYFLLILGSISLVACSGAPTLVDSQHPAGKTGLHGRSKKAGKLEQNKRILPAAGEALLSIIGDVDGTVTVSPSEKDIKVLEAINELRTKGTFNGRHYNARCETAILPALKYAGVLAYAAHGHVQYLVNNPMSFESDSDDLHKQKAGKSFYTGEDTVARITAAALDTNLDLPGTKGEIVAAGQDTVESTILGWLTSSGHCEAIFDKDYTHFGSAYLPKKSEVKNSYSSWVVNFGAY